MSGFLHALSEYRFMQFALGACLLASIGCGTIGAYVVIKRIGFIAGGIAHTVLAGLGIAYFLGAAPLHGAIVAALVAAVLIGWIRLRWRQDEDVLIAATWSVGMAVGILFIARTPGYTVDLTSYLFGNILLVSEMDLALMAALDALIIAVVLLFHRQFLATAFDEEFARLRGVNVEFFYIFLLCIVALTVVLLIQIVGLILVMALLVLPAAAASLHVTSVTRMMLLAVAFSALVTTAGLAASFAADLPAGATMVVAAGVLYAAALALRKSRGLTP
jgi:zinc transport system permease protein